MRKILTAIPAALGALGILALIAAFIVGAATASAAPAAHGQHHRLCGQSAWARRGASLITFARDRGTSPIEVIGATFACYQGEPPGPVVGYVNAGGWRCLLPSHVRLFWPRTIFR